MKGRCPIVNGAGRKIIKLHYNLYCLQCDVEFPEECSLICEWPGMQNVNACPIKDKCPCLQKPTEERRKTIIAWIVTKGGV